MFRRRLFALAVSGAALALLVCCKGKKPPFPIPSAPVLQGTVPASPANQTMPQVLGKALPDRSVGIFSDAACATLLEEGESDGGGDFSITVTVPANATTVLYAALTDGMGKLRSPCSESGLTYVEDSLAPASPTITGALPASPADDATPTVSGSAETGSSVQMYTDGACTNAIGLPVTADAVGAFSIGVTVPEGSTTTFHAKATDAAGNASACSTTNTTYTDLAPTSLVFGVFPPAGEAIGATWDAFTVRVEDQLGGLVSGDNTTQIQIQNVSGPGTLSGTLTRTVSGGIATFDDLSYNMVGTVGFDLVDISNGLDNAAVSGVDVDIVSTIVTDWAQMDAGGYTCAVKTDGRLFCWGYGALGGLGNESSGARAAPVQEATRADDWAQVSVGDAHACAVKTDHTLFCWGRGNAGQIGNNATTDRLIPVQEFSMATDWAQVSAGGEHTCAVKTGGELYCWGEGSAGRLGRNSTADSAVPVQEFSMAGDWKQVTAAGLHTCAVKTDGRVFCWGSGSLGQLGTNGTGTSLIPVQEFTGATDWDHVSASNDHTCAVKTDKRLFCWGYGQGGRLGNNDTANALAPGQEFSMSADWAFVSAGESHTCARKTDNKVFCWGLGDDDRLGTKNNLGSLVPVQETTSASDWAWVSAGGAHSCALKTSGRLYCWGASTGGTRGDNTDGGEPLPKQESSAATDWMRFSAGGSHTCAIKTDRSLFCWGKGDEGQLGNNAMADSFVPVQEFSMATDWDWVVTGFAHTCALKTDNRIFCWGRGGNGQLGNNDTASSPVPVQEFLMATDWDEPAANGDHTCALKSDGRVFCWGRGTEGQLGNNVEADSDVPVQELSGATDWDRIAVGGFHTCAIKTDDRLFCWGAGDQGQLGNAGSGNVPFPVQEASLASDWEQVTAGYKHSCARKTDNRLLCWGSGADGLLGNNDESNTDIPVQEFTGATDWAQVSAGWYHNCARKSDGRVFCWGDGENAQPGIGDSVDAFLPMQEATAAVDWTDLSASGRHTCALKSDGGLYCWGFNPYGQLGSGGGPVEVAQPLATASPGWSQVEAGENSCAVRAGGELFCWGVGGSLGTNWTDRTPSPKQEFTKSADWDHVSVGVTHACGVRTDGRLYCWGNATSGRLGNNDNVNDTRIPTQEFSAATDWDQVSAGEHHTCAVKTDHTLFCWGFGWKGRLGNNGTMDSLVPDQEFSTATDWAQVSAGSDHTCAVKTDGRLFCWGSGADGRLGTNGTADSLVPVQEFSMATDWAQVSAGDRHTCATKTTGQLYCWGLGTDGRLGNNGTGGSLTPNQEFTGAADWSEVSAGESHTCAVKTDGGLYCWGNNFLGRLGINGTSDSLIAAQEFTGAADWAQVSAGEQHTCATKTDGRVFCWGSGSEGRLGTNATTTALVPSQEATAARD